LTCPPVVPREIVTFIEPKDLRNVPHYIADTTEAWPDNLYEEKEMGA